jgi:hypothetical protein
METTSKTGGFISEISFDDGQKFKIEKNDIVVFVGANNVGKSQSLKDIYTLCDRKIPTKVIKNIKVEKNAINLKKFIESISIIKNKGFCNEYEAFGFNYNDSLNRFENFSKDYSFGYFRNIFVANLGTENRLTISNPPAMISRDKVYQHPIHFAAFDNQKANWLSTNFKKAFGKDIEVNTQHGTTIPLCIGDKIKLEDVKKRI